MALTVNNELLELENAFKVQISKSLNVPASDLEASFLFNEKIDEIKSIEVYEDDEMIFDGIVDTQSVELDDNGSLFTIRARSKAAILLDNEALPQIYYRPSLFTIFNRHVKPYGFKSFVGDDKAFSNEFVVSKGMSEWEVVESFCWDYLKVYPRMTLDGILNVGSSLKESSKEIIFSNIQDNAIRYSSIIQSNKRCKVYSDVILKGTNELNYKLKIENEAGKNRGIKRVRYLNVSDSFKTPASYADLLISNGNSESFEVTLSCPGSIFVDVGDVAKVNDYTLGEIKNLKVVKTKYILNEHGERTDIVLQRSEI